MRTRAFVLYAALLVHIVRAWRTGAPCEDQHTLAPSEAEYGPPLDASQEPPYHLSIVDARGQKVRTYVPLQPYTVRLVSTTYFRALLMQARLATRDGFVIGHLRAGRFIEQTEWQNYGIKLQDCRPQYNNSITNIDFSKKFVVEVQWKVEANVGPIQFVLTIIQEQQAYWSHYQPTNGLLVPATSSQPLEVLPPFSNVVTNAGVPSAATTTPLPSRIVSVQKVNAAITTAQPGNASDVVVGVQSSLLSTLTNDNVNDLVSALAARSVDNGGLPINLPQSRPISSNGASQPSIDSAQILLLNGVPSDVQSTPLVNISGVDNEGRLRITSANITLSTDRPVTTTPNQNTSTTTDDFKPLPIPKANSNIEREVDPRTNRVKVFLKNTHDSCTSNPCQHEGRCTNRPEDDTYVCECPQLWTGKSCELSNHCTLTQCANDGICRNRPDRATCDCAQGWGGDNCTIACPSSRCVNGGKCIVRNEQTSIQYGCECVAGYTGERCETEINECDSSPCVHGTCTDQLNGYTCSCSDGFMGPMCHRPCQDIYKSCMRWEHEDRCQSMRQQTKFFDINCAVTCKMCHYDNTTVRTDKPLPPVLEVFTNLIGQWYANSSRPLRHPVDFTMPDEAAGYDEFLSFAVAEVPMFGTPSINYSKEGYVTNGFLTLNARLPKDRPDQIALLTVGSDGLIMIEEGTLLNRTVMQMHVQYEKQHSDSPIAKQTHSLQKSKRTYKMTGVDTLQEYVERELTDGTLETFTKYFTRIKRLVQF